MQIGDLIRFDERYYPQYRGFLGVLVRLAPHAVQGWVVMVGGRLHPFYITEDEMEVVNESR